MCIVRLVYNIFAWYFIKPDYSHPKRKTEKKNPLTLLDFLSSPEDKTIRDREAKGRIEMEEG